MAIIRCCKIAVLIMGSISLALVASGSASAQDDKYGGELGYGEVRSISEFNPYQRPEPGPISDRFYTLIYNTLVSYDYTQERIVPELATNWETSSSQGGGQAPNQITFEIRDDVFWHDGERLTAADVGFTYRYIRQGASNEAAVKRFASLIESVEVNPTDNTVTFDLVRPTPDPAQQFSSLWVIPEHKFDDRYLPKGEDEFGREPVGTGPYKFVGRDMEATVELTAFEDYWDGRPYIGTTELRRFLDPNTMVLQARAGQVRLLVETPPNQAGELESAGFRLKNYQSLSFHAFAYNNAHPILGRTKVRRALTRAVDRKSLLENWYGGEGRVIGGPLVPTHPFWNPDVQPREHSPEKARQLLDEAGCVDRNGDGVRETEEGRDLSFRLTTIRPKAAGKTTKQNVAQSYASQLQEIGVRVETDPLTAAEYAKKVEQNQNFDIAWINWQFDPSYDITSLFLSDNPRGDNVVNYSNDEVDRLLKEFRRSDDPDARSEYMDRAQEIIHEESPYTFLYTLRNVSSISTEVSFTEIDPYYFFSDYDNWYIPADYQE